MEPFIILNAYCILVCSICQYGVPVQEAPTHLAKHHRSIPTSQRKSILQAIQPLGLIKDQKALEWFPLPQSCIPATPELAGPYDDGFQCSRCAYIVRNLTKMKEHCRVVHSWVNPRTKGGDVAKKAAQTYEYPWRTGVLCQRFFPSRRGSGWFEVAAERESLASPAVRQIPPQQEETFVSTLLSQFQQVQRRTTDSTNNEGKAEPNPWLRRVGWAEHFESDDTQFIYRTASLDIEDGWEEGDFTVEKETLQQVWESLSRVIYAAQKACSYEEAGSAVLFEIGRKVVTMKPTTPFPSRLEARTMERYINVWKRVLGYIFRTVDLDDGIRPDYEWTREQEKSLSRFRELLRRASAGDGAGEKELDRAHLDFLITVLDHPLPGRSYDSVLLSALAALGIREDGGWRQPVDYTSFYSAIIKIARMLVVRHSQLEAEDAGNAGDQDGTFAIVRRKVSRFMTVVHPGNQPTPMDWIFDARSYGLKIRYTTSIAGQISWVGSTVTFQKVVFSIEGLTDMLHELVSSLRRTMDNLLLVAHGAVPPSVDWEQLYDDMGNEGVGFSFLRDPRNTQLQAFSS